jgi:hypothetical protein
MWAVREREEGREREGWSVCVCVRERGAGLTFDELANLSSSFFKLLTRRTDETAP